MCIISKYLKRIFGLTSARDQDKLTEHSIFQIVQFTGNELRIYTISYLRCIVYTNKKLANTAAIVFIKDNHVSLLKQRAIQETNPRRRNKKTRAHTSRISRYRRENNDIYMYSLLKYTCYTCIYMSAIYGCYSINNLTTL